MKRNRFIFWAPRILPILFLLFMALFSLDVFDSCSGWDCALGLLIHNIPALILLIVLLVSWKYEIVGAVAFIFAGLLYLFFVFFNIAKTGFEWYYLAWAAQISGVAFFIGIMFLLGWMKK
jgi:hypothetical protein